MIVQSGKTRTPHRSTLKALALSTALAGSMVLLPGAARAQNTPGGQTVVSPGGANAPTFNGSTSTLSGNATNLDVDLRGSNTIINWNQFNIAQGSHVDFGTGLAGQVAVLNRVTGPGSTTIRGSLTSDANVNVFLVNSNGIMVSGTGSVSTGSFVASTLDISNSDFTAGNYNFSAGGSAGTVTVNGSVTTRGTGIGLILLGRQVVSSGTLDSGTQDTALVAADDVTLNFTPGSPLGVQIDAGTNVGNAMRVVGGTIQGRNVYFAMATRGGVTNALLQVDGDVRAVSGDKGIVIVAGRSTVDPDVTVNTSFGANTSGSVGVATSGRLEYSGSASGAGVHIGGTDDVTIAGDVSSQGDYLVRGPSVTLGAAGNTVRQEAVRGVSITASNGDITGLGTLTLASDTGGAGGRALVLDADDDIDFGSATTLEAGGAGLASAVNLFSGSRNGNIRLGNVNALALDGGVSGGPLDGKLFRQASFGNGGDITLGAVSLGGAATIQADDLTVTSLTAPGAVSLQVDTLRAGSIRSTGSTTTLDASSIAGLTAGARTGVSAAGAVTIDVSGNALLGAVESTGAAVTLDADSFDAASVSAATGATLTSHNGDARLGGLTVSGGSATLVADDDAFVLGPVSVAGDYSVTGDAVSLSGTQAATGAATITARSGTIGNPAALTLTANSDGSGTEALTLAGRVNLGSTSTLNGGLANQSAVVIDTGAGNDVRLGNVNAASLSIAGGATLNGNLALGNVVTASDLALRSNQSIQAGNLSSTAGRVQLQAPTLSTGDLNAATDVSLSGRQVDFGAITAATAALATTGTNGSPRLSGTSIVTSGATTLTSDGGPISIGSIQAGGLNVTSAGAVTLGTVGIAGDATLTTTGPNDIQLTSLTATGAVSLTSGDDIAAGSVTSSGGTVTIAAADDLTGLGGGRAALAAAGALAVTAGGDARLGSVSGNTINLEAATLDAGALSGPAGITLAVTGGGLTLAGLSTSAGNVSLTASGAVTVNGPVSIVGNYAVTGAGVALGGTQDATGTIDVTATRGTLISSVAGLRLTANSDGSGTEALTLHGGANLGADSLLRGGPARQSQVVIDSSAAGNFRLGDIDAGGLVIAGGAPLSGSLTFGNVTTTGAVTLVVDGGINGTGITSTAGAVSLSGAGAATLGTLSGSTIEVSMLGNVGVGSFTATGGAAHLASTGGSVTLGSGSATGDVRVEGVGTVSIADAIGAGGDYRVRGGSVILGADGDDELQSAGGLIDVTSTSGTIAGGTGLTLRSGTGAVILDGAGGIDFGAGLIQAGTDGTGQLGLRAGSGQAIDLGDLVKVGTIGSVDAGHATIAAALSHNGDLRFGTLTSANAVDIQLAGGTLAGTSLNGAGAVTLAAGSGTIDLGALSGSTLTVSGGALQGGTWTASGDATLTGGAVTLASLDSSGGAASATANAGTLSIDTAHAATNLTLTANVGDVSVGSATAGGNVSLIAPGGSILTDQATAGGTLTLNSGGDIRGRSGTSPNLSGTNVVLQVVGNLATGSITSPGGLSITSGSMNIGSVQAGTALSLTTSSGNMTLGSATAGGAISLTSAGGIDVGTLTSGAGVSLAATGALRVSQLTAPGAVTANAGTGLTLDRVDAAALTTNAGAATLGTLNLGTLTLGGGSASIANATVTGATSADLTGTLAIDTLSGATVALKAGTLTASDLTTSGAASLTGGAGGVRLGTFKSNGAATIGSAGDVAVTSWQAPAGMTITAANAVTLGTGTAGALTVTAGSLQLADGTVSGDATLTATGALGVTRLRAANAILKGGSTTLGTLNAATLNLSGGSATIADATLSGAATTDLSGTLGIDKLSAGTATLLAGGAATLGTVTGGTALTVRAGDLTLNGTLKAPTVTLGSRDPAAGLRLGSAGDGGGAGAGLSESEIGRIDADHAVFDGGSGPVTIGTLAFGGSAGRSRVDVLSSGDVLVNGTVQGDGAGRTFRLGGTTDENGLASTIQVLATADAGGRLLFGNADLELRGARIGVGQNGLLDGLFANGGASADQAAALIGNSNSPLYSALAGGSPYVTGQETTVTAGRLTVRLGEFALFQNTGTRGFNTGVVLSGNPSGGPTLTVVGPGGGRRTAFAMFGTINGVSGTSTAVLGNTVISASGIDLANARVNGCVLGTAAGCLTTTISQPTLNVFDPGRLVVVRAEADFTLPFDPVLGSNNEALFAGVGSIAPPEDPDEERRRRQQPQPDAAQQPTR